MLPVDEELLLLLLIPLLPLLWVDCRWNTSACQRIVGVILRTGVRWWAEALARLVIPGSTSLQAGRGGRGVPAVAAARLLPPLLVIGPAAGRLQATPTPTGKLILHLQGGALLLARAATKGAPWTTRSTSGKKGALGPTLRAALTPCAFEWRWEHRRSNLRGNLRCISSPSRGTASAGRKSCSTATESSPPSKR